MMVCFSFIVFVVIFFFLKGVYIVIQKRFIFNQKNCEFMKMLNCISSACISHWTDSLINTARISFCFNLCA